MRKVSLILMAALLLSSGSIFANTPKKDNPTKNLSSQIASFLEDNEFTIKENNLTANVLFTLNKNSEIVVVSVETKDGNLEAFVKARLNYQKVEVAQLKEGRMYTVPVRITI